MSHINYLITGLILAPALSAHIALDPEVITGYPGGSRVVSTLTWIKVNRPGSFATLIAVAGLGSVISWPIDVVCHVYYRCKRFVQG